MAKVEINAITQHLRGKVGDLVFKLAGGQLIAALRPKPFTGPPSAGQLDVRLRFRKGIAYAIAALADPASRGPYERASVLKQKSAFALAVGDYFTSPTVDDIDLGLYHGHVGEKIVMIARDDVEVASVAVVIRSSSGIVLEQGAAVFSFNRWSYTATTTLAAGANVTIEATAKDHATNTGLKQQPYHQP